MNTYLTRDEQSSHQNQLTWSLELSGENQKEHAIIRSFNDRLSGRHLLHPFIYEELGKQIKRIEQVYDLSEFKERTEWNRSSGNGIVKFDIFFSRNNTNSATKTA